MCSQNLPLPLSCCLYVRLLLYLIQNGIQCYQILQTDHYRLISPPFTPLSDLLWRQWWWRWISWLSPAVGGYAGVVCGSLSCQREEWSHHVSSVRHRDPAGDWHQQPSAPTQTPLGHPGDGLPHQPVSTPYLQNGTIKQQIHLHDYSSPCM